MMRWRRRPSSRATRIVPTSSASAPRVDPPGLGGGRGDLGHEGAHACRRWSATAGRRSGERATWSISSTWSNGFVWRGSSRRVSSRRPGRTRRRRDGGPRERAVVLLAAGQVVVEHGDGQLLLRGEVGVEGAAGEAGGGGDLLDGGGADTPVGEHAGGRVEQSGRASRRGSVASGARALTSASTIHERIHSIHGCIEWICRVGVSTPWRRGRASRTAEHNALFRALETTRPAGERLVDDPLRRRVPLPALPGPRPARRGGADPGRHHRRHRPAVARGADRGGGAHPADRRHGRRPGRGHGAGGGAGGRVRHARRGGSPAFRGRAVVEVDHPDTQRAKRAALRRAAGRRAGAGASVRFVPTDFRLGGFGRRHGRGGVRPVLAHPVPVGGHHQLPHRRRRRCDAAVVCRARRRAAGWFSPTSTAMCSPIRVRIPAPTRCMATLRRAGEPMTFGLVPRETGEYLAAPRARPGRRRRRRRRPGAVLRGGSGRDAAATSSTGSPTPACRPA